MDLLNNFLKETTMLSSRKISENMIKFGALSKEIKLFGKCNESMINAKIVSKNGNVLYSVDESEIDEVTVIDKLSEITDLYSDASEISTETEITPEAEICQKAPLEDAICDNYTFCDVVKDLIAIADKASQIPNKPFDDTDLINKSIAFGLVSGIYATAQNFIDAGFAVESDAITNESLSVPAKVDYIDLASNCISRACLALASSDNYKSLIGNLKDIKSELDISK